jgi:hypothetical protein
VITSLKGPSGQEARRRRGQSRSAVPVDPRPSAVTPVAQPDLETIRSNPSRSNASSVVVRTFPSEPT